MRKIGTFSVLVFLTVLVVFIPIQAALAESGFTNTKRATGVIMKFCANEAFTLQDCNERYHGIGWTDRVNVLIYAPGWNVNEFSIDEIGGEDNPIDVYTDAARINNVEFSETGPDTGIFMGVIKLSGEHGFVVHDTFKTRIHTHGHTHDADATATTTHATGHGHNAAPQHGHNAPPPATTGHGHNAAPQHVATASRSSHDRAAMIATSPQDGRLTVSWEPNDDTIIIKSAYYGWEIGQVEFDKEAYDVNEEITFFMRDNDLWIHHAQFFTNYVRVYSESDPAGIFVGVQFVRDMEHAKVTYENDVEHLTEPASNSLTKYTPDGKWKTYLWTEPGGVIGVNQDYDFNLMVHDGKTDVHEMGLAYNMDIYLNGELIDSRPQRYAVDGQGIEPVRFDERGSAKIVISNIFDQGEQVDFSFQVAPEAIIEKVTPRHSAFERGTIPDEYAEHEHPHHINYLPGKFFLTTEDSSDSQNKLRVSPDGDTIYVEYEDLTLPKPYTESDSVDIVATAFVIDGNYDYSTNSEPFVLSGAPSTDIIAPVSADTSIQPWVKKNVSLWSDGQINDSDFIRGVEYLVQNNMIDVDSEPIEVNEDHVRFVPAWVKNNAMLWSEGYITDTEFANGIEYLVSVGLIQV